GRRARADLSGTPPDDVDISPAESVPAHSLASHRAREGRDAGAPVRRRWIDRFRPVGSVATRRSCWPTGRRRRSCGRSPHGADISRRDSMHLGIATDHGGFHLKQDLLARLRAAGHDVADFGADALNPDDDYPDFVIPLAQAVAAGTIERGIAV